jgi:hypothetical protein
MLSVAAFAVGCAGYFGYRLDNLYVNGMPPWDASFYTRLARDFYGTLSQAGPYTIQRILPSAIIYHLFRALSVQPTDENIILGFVLLNALLITLTGYLFALVADELGISRRGKWLGFVGLFFNFAVLKHRLYDPVLTDTSAYATGMLLLYFYLKRKRAGLLISTALGAFVWPTILLQGTLLLAFPRPEASDVLPVATGVRPVSARPFYLKAGAVAISLLVSLAGLLLILYVLRVGVPIVLPVFRPSLPLSIAVVVLYLFYGMKTLLLAGELLNVDHLLSYLAKKRVVLGMASAVLLFVLVKLAQAALTQQAGPNYPVSLYVLTTFWVCVIYPAVFLISHVVYFGPIVLLLLFLRKEVCRLIQEHGLGLWLCAALSLLLSLNSESRQMINFLPVFVVFVARATDDLRWGKAQYWLLAVLSLLLSKAWLRIGPLRTEGMTNHEILLSNQLLFMNNGPAMSGRMYVVQGCAVLVVGLVIYYVCIRRGRASRGPGSHP